jgi:hypothetical protein
MPITSTPYTAVYGPLSVAGATCTLWLDGADATTIGFSSGSNVNLWKDKSSNGFNATNTSIYPTYSGSNLVFTSSQQLRLSPFIPAATKNITIAAIWTCTSASTGGAFQSIIEQNAATGGAYWRYMIQGYGFLGRNEYMYGLNEFGANPTPGTSFPTFVVGTPNLSVITQSSTDGTNFTINNYSYGSLYGTQTYGTAVGAGIQGTIGLNTNGEGFTGVISEIIIFTSASSVLSIQQRQAIEGYLAQKWGLTSQLPPGHPGLTQTFYNSKVYQSRIPLSPQPIYQNFNPTQLTGCQLWLDGADPAGTGTPPANGATVSTWIDKSGNGRNAPANTIGGTFNRNTLNGNGGINFDTLNTKYYRTPSFVASSTNTPTIFLVCQQTVYNFSQNTTFLYAEINYLQFILYTRTAGNTNINMNLDMYNTDPSTGLTGIPISSPAIVSVVGTGAPSYTAIMYGNGTFNLSFTGTATNPMSTSSPYLIGSCIGNIYEIIFYDTALTDTQRQQIEGYLAWKWGLQNSLVSHPYKNIPPGLPWESSVTSGLTRLPPIVATGGTITFSGSYKIHTFTTVGTTNFVVSQVLPTGFSLQVLVVGGGAGGGVNSAGGGGAGGAIFVTSQTVTSGSYSIVVGAGGSGGINLFAPLYGAVGSNGSNSTAFGYTGIGGGGGGYCPQSSSNVINGVAGGCGGGGAAFDRGASAGIGGTPLQAGGFAGGNGVGNNSGGAGGGGMGSVGSNGSGNIAGSGGNGATYTIGGTAYTLSGGGGGGSYAGSTTSSGGSGGGGAGAQVTNTSGSNATYYGSGGGGGAGGGGAPKGGDGYQGIVIIAYNYL